MFGAKTPFGSGGFGSSTSAFGTQQSTPFGGNSGGLFGSKTPAAGSFGTPSFGSTTPATGGLFGGTSTGTGLFGSKTTQATTGFGGFGTSTGTSGGLFGGSGTSLFQTPQASSGFGTKTSGFGGFGNNTAFGASSGTTFGTSTASGGGLFGGGTSVFSSQQATSGTTIKFTPVTSQEQTQKSGITMTVKTQNQCITVMDAYKEKSLEELRFEDYAAGRKGSQSSGFGGTSSGGLFGGTSGQGTSLFGTTTSKQSGFGGFGSTTTSGGLFGQNSGGGLFGAKTTQSIFGGTNTSSSTGFGGFGGTSGGLFGGTSSTGTSLFGNTSTQQSSLFGTNSGFGSTAGTSAGGFGFGTSSAFGQPQASQSGGLFGASKPTFGGFGASSGTGFGTSNTFSFGNAASSGGGLFGSTSKPGFTFGGGNTGFGTSTSSFGGFGGTTSSSGGLFGNTSSSGLFGTKTGFGTTGFGGTSTGGTSLFGGAGFGGSGTTGFGTMGSANTGLSLGAGTLGGLSNIDQSTLTAFQQQQMIQKQLKAIANTPFGDSALFRNLADSKKEKPTSITKATSTLADPLQASSQYKVLARPVSRVKPRQVSSPSLGKSRLFEGLDNEVDFSPHPLVPRRSIKKLVIKDKSNPVIESPYEEGNRLKLRQPDEDDNDDLVSPSPDVIKAKPAEQNGIDENTPKSGKLFNNTMSELNDNSKTPVMKKINNYVLTPESNTSDEVGKREPVVKFKEDSEELPACKIILRRPEYYTRPTVATLDRQVNENHCIVRDFTVGREGYGEVKFLGNTDVYGLNLDEIVFFRRREVEVYPDDYSNKPEVGDDLNKPAEITLLKVWPNDKSNHTPVKSPERLKAAGFIDRIEEKTLAMDAVFIDYRPKEGAWVFKVNHFTRYGIQEQYINDAANQQGQRDILKSNVQKKQLQEYSMESDVDFDKENIGPLTKEYVKTKVQKMIQDKILEKENVTFEEEEVPVSTQTDDVMDDGEKRDSHMDDGDETHDESQRKENDMITCNAEIEDNRQSEEGVNEEFLPSSHQIGHIARVQPFNLQGMKTSVLDDDDIEDMPVPSTFAKRKQVFSNKSIFGSTYVEQNQTDKPSSPFPKLDLSSNVPQKQNHLNAAIFKNVTTSESPSKIPKTMHLFQRSLLTSDKEQDNTDSSTSGKPSYERLSNQPVSIKCKTFEMVKYEQSLLFGRQSCLADASLTHGRQFRVSWNSQLRFLHSGLKVGSSTADTTKLNTSIFDSNFVSPVSTFGLANNVVNEEQLNVDSNPGMKQFIESCMDISLKHTTFESTDKSVLKLPVLDSGLNVIAQYAKLAQGFMNAATEESNMKSFKVNAEVWDLINALWGKQELDSHLGSIYEVHAARRASVSGWLSKYLTQAVKTQITRNKVEDDGHLSTIFTLLSSKQIRDAVQVARDNNETRLAFLLAQVAGDHHLKHYIRSQLTQWEEGQIDEFMNVNRLKIYVLLSGMMVWKSAKNYINLCEGLDWKRALALHIWFYCSPTASIYDAFVEYQSSFKGTETYEPYSSYPTPSFMEEESDASQRSSDHKTKDLCYHLLALYCKRPHSLEKLLTTKTYSSNPLDAHLSWHIHQVFEELGYNHMKEDRHALLQQSYATQLESVGLWHWGVFVLMHMKDPGRREFCVKDLLSRYCRVNDEPDNIDFTEEERKLVEEFHVPRQWVHQAKALHAKYMERRYEEALHLIRADLWNDAHTVIMQHVAIDAIIEEEYDLLKNLLLDISLPERCCTVKHWKIGGRIFMDYILLNEKLDSIQNNRVHITNYHLEDMEAEVASLINRISIMDVKTARDRLCQSEMARTCSNMLKIVFSCMKSDDESFDNETPSWLSAKVAPYVAELPLPPDYYLKELREVLANYMQELNAEGV